MCISPALSPDGLLVSCRKCWQCRKNKIEDWVGRCIAESETAKACHAITLTYGKGDHERAAVLTYSDCQKYFKLLRKHGYPLRYFAVGEYGSLKGRSHWHVVIFWQDRVPCFWPGIYADGPGIHQAPEPYPLGKRFNEIHWPHGASFWEEPSAASIRYICKYIQKDISEAERQGHVSMSKRPPLGHAYFVGLAGRYVEQGLAPQDAFYSFSNVYDDDGKPARFQLNGVSLDKFCQSYLDQWAARHGGHPPQSDLIEAYCDRIARAPNELRLEPFRPRQSYPWIAPPHGAAIQFSENHNAFYYVHDGQRLWWSFDLEGNRAWQSVIRTENGKSLTTAIEAGRYRALTGGF